MRKYIVSLTEFLWVNIFIGDVCIYLSEELKNLKYKIGNLWFLILLVFILKLIWQKRKKKEKGHQSYCLEFWLKIIKN